MKASQVMTSNPRTIQGTETMGKALATMFEHHLHMLPVVDAERAVLGVVTMFSIMAHIVPDYIVSGDLDSVSYAPDIGLMRRRYDQMVDEPVRNVTDSTPLMVRADDSLLSIAASLVTHDRHEYALVIDAHNVLLGVISAGDILANLKQVPGGNTSA